MAVPSKIQRTQKLKHIAYLPSKLIGNITRVAGLSDFAKIEFVTVENSTLDESQIKKEEFTLLFFGVRNFYLFQKK